MKELNLSAPERETEADARQETRSDAPSSSQTNARKPRQFTPAYRSGSFAILLAMYSASDLLVEMSKDQVIDRAQQYCDASFTTPSNQKTHYTAWNSMKTLLDRELVLKMGRTFVLSDEGTALARKLAKTYGLEDAVCPTDVSSGSISALETLESLELLAIDNHRQDTRRFTLRKGTFDIKIVLDNREVRTQRDRLYFQTELIKQGYEVLTHTLSLGDICWVAEIKPEFKQEYDLSISEKRIVLPILIERKSGNDLASSIRDGRFKEQKNRQAACGIKQIIYLLEATDPSDCPLGPTALYTAIAQIQVLDGFLVKQTENAEDTVVYLASMTDALKERYLNSDMVVDDRTELRDFAEFNASNSKRGALTVRAVWMKQLMTVRGISAQKAKAIADEFPTMYSLVQHLYKTKPRQISTTSTADNPPLLLNDDPVTLEQLCSHFKRIDDPIGKVVTQRLYDVLTC